MKYISGIWDIIIIMLGVCVIVFEARMCLRAWLLKNKVREASDDLDMKMLRKCSVKLNGCVSWHSFTGVVITIFPLLGMLGTVIGLLGSAGSEADDISNFLTALTTTFWGIVMSVITKGIEAAWIKLMMDSETVLAPYSEAITSGNTADRYYRKALRYEKGEGIDADDDEAYHCYRQAAELGNADAQYKMGEFSEKGISRAKDMREAEYWYRKAFDGGNDKAGVALKRIYVQGDANEKQDIGD